MEKKVITKVQQQKRHNYFNIYVNNEYCFSVLENILIKFNLFKGRELNDLLITEIKQADQKLRALQMAYAFLSQQLRSEYEIENKLKQAEINEEIIAFVIERLKDERLLDDLLYAQSLVRTIAKTSLKGPGNIKQTLYQKHIDTGVSEIALKEYDSELQIENATKLYFQLHKRYQKLANYAKQQKIYQNLLQKGYSQTIITQVVTENNLPLDDELELDNVQRVAEKIWHRNREIAIGKRKIKTIQSLYNKGFQLEIIQEVVEQLVNLEK